MKKQIKSNVYGNFMFKKRLGQNFITDRNLIAAIVNDAKINKDDIVIEIGAGAGALTEELAKKAKKVFSYEIDSELEPILTERLKEYKNVSLIIKDFLKEDNLDFINANNKKIKVVANLPYYITTPIIFKLIDMENIDSLTLMVQKEVAQRLASKHNSKTYGAITANLAIISDIKITRTVNKQMFFPKPNVDSAIVCIRILKNKFKINDYLLTKMIIKYSFSMRRKTLINNLKKIPNIEFKALEEIINNKCSFKPDVRAENLSPEDFVNLSNLIFEMKIIK